MFKDHLQVIKSVKQRYTPNKDVLDMMKIFRYMVNDCIRIGLQNDCSTLKQLSSLAYRKLEYDILSYYKLSAMSKAVGILSNRNQSIRRGIATKKPYLTKTILATSYGFKFENGVFKIPIDHKTYFEIPLNGYAKQVLSDSCLEIKSFILTPTNINIAYSKKVIQIECSETVGIDRNLRNVTMGNCSKVMQFDLSKTIQIAENT